MSGFARTESSPRDVVVRAFTLADYETVVAVWRAAGLPYRPEGRDSREAVATQLQRGCSIYLVADTGAEGAPAAEDVDLVRPPGVEAEPRQLVGVVFGTHDGRKGWINRLAVVPDFQGRGIARRLVEEVETLLGEQGIDVVAASIESGNEASLAFFGKIGYPHDPGIEYVSKRRDPLS